MARDLREEIIGGLEIDAFLARGGDVMALPDVRQLAHVTACARITPAEPRDTMSAVFLDELRAVLVGDRPDVDEKGPVDGIRLVRHLVWMTQVFGNDEKAAALLAAMTPELRTWALSHAERVEKSDPDWSQFDT